MSRPPTRDQQYIESSYAPPVIDFVRPLESPYTQPSVYAQAGSPGYQPVSMQYPYQAPGYTASPYQAYPAPTTVASAYPSSAYPASVASAYPAPVASAYPAPVASAYPHPYQPTTMASAYAPDTETQRLHSSINARIDSIIEAQRDNAREQKDKALGSLVEKLTRKVSKLEQKLTSEPLAQEDSDAKISERLRALAAESRRRERIPDW